MNRISKTFLACLAMAFLAGSVQADPATEKSAPAVTGEGCARTGTPSLIVKACAPIITADPKRADALAIRASAWRMLGDNEAALKDANAALAIDPDNSLALSRRIVMTIAESGEAAAHDDIAHLFSSSPKQADDFEARGFVRGAQRNLAAAINEYTAGLDLDPTNVGLLNGRALAYSRTNNAPYALSDADKAVAAHPTAASVHYTRSIVLSDARKLDEAIAELDRAIDRDPQWPALHVQRSALYLATKDTAKALADCDEAIKLNPAHAASWFRRASLYLAQAETDKALADFDQGLKLDRSKRPSIAGDMQAHCPPTLRGGVLCAIYDQTKKLDQNAMGGMNYLARGKAYDELRQYRRALADFDMAARLVANVPEVFQRRAAVNEALGFKAQAEEDRRKAAAMQARSPVTMPPKAVTLDASAAIPAATRMALNVASEQIKRKDYDSAIAGLDRILASEPRNWQALNLRGQAHLAKKAYPAAIADLSKSIEIAPRMVGGYLNRSAAYQATGQLPLALADCDKVLELRAYPAFAYLRRASVHFSAKSYDLAIRDYTSALDLAPMEVAAKAIIAEARYGRALSYYFSKDLDHAMEDARLTLKDNPDNIAAMRLLRAVSEPVPDTRPMTVRVVRSAAPDCGETCAEWIAAEGKIDASTPGRFRAVLATLGKRKLPVFIESNGGLTQAGFQVGRLIREKALDVYVTHTQPAACSASADICRKAKAANVSFGIPRGKLAQCASACTFILAAGSVRSAGPSSLVGVHRSGYLDQNGKPLPREAPASVFKQIGSYFSEMGVGGALMVKLQATPFTNMYWLSPNELLESRLVTQTRSGEQLITGDEHDDWIVVSPKAIGLVDKARVAPSALRQ